MRKSNNISQYNFRTMAKAEILKPFILAWEGGFVNNKSDRGGATNRGITIATFRAVYGQSKTVADLKALTDEQWMHVFKTIYWDKCRADEIKNQSVANLLVDFAWGSGTARAAKYIQRLVGVTQDGNIGPKTIAAINARDAKSLFTGLKAERLAFINSIVRNNTSQMVFYKGWVNRLNAIGWGTLTYGGKTRTFAN